RCRRGRCCATSPAAPWWTRRRWWPPSSPATWRRPSSTSPIRSRRAGRTRCGVSPACTCPRTPPPSCPATSSGSPRSSSTTSAGTRRGSPCATPPTSTRATSARWARRPAPSVGHLRWLLSRPPQVATSDGGLTRRPVGRILCRGCPDRAATGWGRGGATMAQTVERRVDGDGHLMEFFGTNIADYLEDPWYSRVRDAAASWAPTAGTTFPWFPGDGWDRNHGADLFKGRGNSADDWLEQMELGPLDVAVLYPSFFLQIGALHHREWPAAGARAYNSWVSAEIVGKGNGKLRAMAVLAPQDPTAAADELRRVVETLGLSGGMLPADTAAQFGDRSFDALYRAAVDVDAPIAVHASGTHLAGGKPFPTFIQTHAYNHPAAVIGQFTSMMLKGSSVGTRRSGSASSSAGRPGCRGTWTGWTRSTTPAAPGRHRTWRRPRASTSGPGRTSSSGWRPTSGCSDPPSTSSGPTWRCTPRTGPTGTASTRGRSGRSRTARTCPRTSARASCTGRPRGSTGSAPTEAARRRPGRGRPATVAGVS